MKLCKKILSVVCLLALAVTLFSCDGIKESPIIAAKRKAQADAETVLSKLVWDVQDMTAITTDLVLSKSNKNFPDVKISWESSEPDVISSTGKVTRTQYDDPRAYVADGNESETYEVEENGATVTKYRDKVVAVELTATVIGSYSYDVEVTDTDGYATFDTVTVELAPITKTFTFTVLTIPHGVDGGTIAHVKAAAWNYIYVVSGVQKGLVSASSTTYAAMTTGVVTAKLLADGATKGFMIHDGTDGIYVYEDNTKVNVGDYVQVVGDIYTYYGSMQFGSNISVSLLDAEPSFTISDEDYVRTTPAELESVQSNYETSIGYFGGKLITLAGYVTARTAPAGSGKYCVVDANDGVETTWFYYKGYNADMEATLKSLDGKYCELKCVTYDRDSRINKNEILWTGEYKEATAPEMSDEAKVNSELGKIQFNEKYSADFKLPTSSVCTLTWSVKSGTGLVIENGTAKVTQSSELQTVVLVATAKLNNAEASKEFTIKIPAAESQALVPTIVENPEVGKEYYLGYTHETKAADYFFAGTIANKYYYGTTEEIASAVKVQLESATNGYYLFSMVDGAKKYLNCLVSGTYYNCALEDAASTVWTFDAQLKTLKALAGEVEIFLGGYGTYTTIATGNSDKITFKTHLYTLAESTEPTPTSVPTVVENPEVGKEYFLGYAHETNAKDYFFNGTIANKYYYGTVEGTEGAVKVQLEAATNGYYLFCMVDGAKKYLNCLVSGTHYNCGLEDTASTVWTFDAQLKTLKTLVDTTELFLGGYGTYSTLSIGNDGKMTFKAHLYILAESTEPVNPEPTPTLVPTVVENPEVGKDYFLGYAHETNAKDYFFNGTIANKYYYGTVEGTEGAVKVQLEAATNGYYLFTMIDGAKKYLNCLVSGTHYNCGLEDAASTVWTFDSQLKTLKTLVDGTELFLGGYGTYSTLSIGNDGKMTFKAHLYVLAESTEPVNPDPEPTPDPEPSVDGVLATFTFGADGAAKHVDGTGITSYTEENNGYTLNITDAVKVYSGAFDLTGKSALKLGTGSLTASFKFTVDESVKSVVIYVAKYKLNASQFTINGGEPYDVPTSSNDGDYTAFTIDTSTVKTITFATTADGKRVMIDKIEFKNK